MYIISKNLKDHWFNYIWQSLAAGIVTTLSIFIFSEIVGLFILAGVGSTFFTIFTLPHNRTARSRNVLGSYIISVIIGFIFTNHFPAYISGGIAVGLAAFLMVITDTEHPPAAGVTLGLALASSLSFKIRGAGFALMGAFLSAFLRYNLKPWLKDLF